MPVPKPFSMPNRSLKPQSGCGRSRKIGEMGNIIIRLHNYFVELGPLAQVQVVGLDEVSAKGETGLWQLSKV
jgi:hypothetical protein